MRVRVLAAVAALLLLSYAPPAVAAVRKIRTPAHAVHTEFVVEVNRKGQIARVRTGKSSPDSAFNTMTYGNALQAFIRTPDGRAVAGTYRLTYDFNPATQRVKRAVSLLRAGHVNPDAPGAVEAMAAIAKRRAPSGAAVQSPLPDFKSITGH